MGNVCKLFFYERGNKKAKKIEHVELKQVLSRIANQFPKKTM